MLSEVESRGATYIRSPRFVDQGSLTFRDSGNWPPPTRPLTAAVVDAESSLTWTRRLLGDQSLEVIYLPSGAFSADDGERIQATFPEALLLPAPFGGQWTYSLGPSDY
jgi:hypothetical protein